MVWMGSASDVVAVCCAYFNFIGVWMRVAFACEDESFGEFFAHFLFVVVLCFFVYVCLFSFL